MCHHSQLGICSLSLQSTEMVFVLGSLLNEVALYLGLEVLCLELRVWGLRIVKGLGSRP